MEFLNKLDFSILNFIAAYFQCTWLNTWMPVITTLGNNGFIWTVLALVLVLKKEYRKTGIGIILVLALGFIVCNLGIKPLVARIRPFEFNTAVQLLVSVPHDYSFPSGHTEASFAAVTVLFLNQIKGRYLALLAAVLIGFSRLYLYLHYPTDVFAGALLGICLGFLAVYLLNQAAVWKNKQEWNFMKSKEIMQNKLNQL